MSLLTSLFRPVVGRFSANQPPSSQSDLQACDRAHASTDGHADVRAAHHDGMDEDAQLAGSQHSQNRIIASLGHEDDALRPGRTTIPSNTITNNSNPAGRSGSEPRDRLAVEGIPGGERTDEHSSAPGSASTQEQNTDSNDTTPTDGLRPPPTPGAIDMPRHRSRPGDEAGQAGSLPADDGMASLRKKIHEIRDMAASSEDKARRLHALMTESYVAHMPHLAQGAHSPTASFASNDHRPFTPNSPHSPGGYYSGAQSPRSPASFADSIDPANPYNLQEEDKVPTYRPSRSRRPSAEYEINNVGVDELPEPSEPQLGCKHYKRNVKIQCYDCRRWYSCRHCHDEAELSHSLVRRKTENMFCMLCSTPQTAGEFCQKCNHRAAWYYCDICKLWDDDNNKRIYHCVDCGICRRGEGIGKDFVHCKKCNICIAIGSAATHRCIERAAECDCPICGDYMFTSSASIVAMPCGHYLHKSCYTRYMETAYKCPICKKSAVNMELQWRKLEHAIESQPMPREFRDTRIVVQCNDCSAKSSVRYHWLGNQCATCDSFNTNELQLLGPGSEAVQRNTADHQRQRIEPQPPPMQLEDGQAQQSRQQPAQQQPDVRPRLSNPRTHTLPGALPVLGHRLSSSYFLSVQDSTSDTSVRTSITQNIPFSPLEVFHRVSRSLSPIRHYLIADSGDEAVDDGEDGDDVVFWGADGGRFLSGEEDGSDSEEDDEDDDDEYYDDEDESEDELLVSDGEDGEGRGGVQRPEGQGSGHARRELDDLDDLIGHR